MPAGFAPGGLPVGIELLARPLDDARLVAFAYAYEQAVHPRRPPSTTPPLTGALVRAAVSTFSVSASVQGLQPASLNRSRAEAVFSLDRLTRTLSYEVTLTGVPAEDVYAIVVRREAPEADASPRWRVVQRLSGPGVLDAAGSWTLTPALLERLERGELHLEVFTRQNPAGEVRARITP
jgi:hypothetical protein